MQLIRTMGGPKIKAPFFRRETQSQHIKGSFFFQSRLSIFTLIAPELLDQSNKNLSLSFSSIEINKPFSVPTYSVLWVRSKFRRLFLLLSEMRCLITITAESSIISIDSSITENIIRKIINVSQNQQWSFDKLQH